MEHTQSSKQYVYVMMLTGQQAMDVAIIHDDYWWILGRVLEVNVWGGGSGGDMRELEDMDRGEE